MFTTFHLCCDKRVVGAEPGAWDVPDLDDAHAAPGNLRNRPAKRIAHADVRVLGKGGDKCMIGHEAHNEVESTFCQ